MDQNNFEVCSTCGRFSISAGKPEGKPLCTSCITRYKKHCKICGTRGVFSEGKCEACFKANKELTRNCSVCHKLYMYQTKREDGMCVDCYHKIYVSNSPKEECFHCENFKPVALRLENGRSCCGNCRKKFHADHQECPRCRNTSYLFYSSIYGSKVCGSCDADLRSRYTNRICKGCGKKYSMEEIGLEIYCINCR